MHKIIIAVAAVFILVASVFAGTPEISPVVDTQGFVSSSNPPNKPQYVPSEVTTKSATKNSSKNTIKPAEHKKNKKSIKPTKQSTQTASPMACWVVEDNGVVGYTCRNSKKIAASTPVGSGEIVGVEEKNIRNVGAVEEIGATQRMTIPKKKRYVAPVKIGKMQQVSFSQPSFCNGIRNSTGSCAKDLNSNIANVVAINSSEKVGKKIGHLYLGVMAGVGFARLGVPQIVDVNGLYDQYIPTDNYSSTVYGLNGGYEFKLGSSGLLSMGIGVYQNLNYISKGQVWDASIAIGTHNLDYEYKLQSTRFMFETQFAWQFDLNKIKLIPFVLLGAGPSLNFANGYVDTLINPAVILGPGSQSNRNTSFAYQLGAGISCPIGNDLNRLFAAYKYVDLGTAQFNSNGASDYQLDVGRIRANEVYIGYTHLFDF